MTIENFVSRIKDFESLSPGSKIDYFVYFHTIIKGEGGAKSKDVDGCFSDLKSSKYSNTAQYLRLNSKKSKKASPKFIAQNGKYHLERARKLEIDGAINAVLTVAIVPTDNYFPVELFKNTRGYLQIIALQAAGCYDGSMYDACSVMTRKLLEVLIIEAFERYGISSKVKNDNGNFFYLSDLIEKFKLETAWNVGRNAKESLPKLKKMGDLSAHNRRYIAKKPDLDLLKGDLRIVLEELIHLIDYPNWKNS